MKTVDEALAFAERVYSRVSDAGIIAAEVRRPLDRRVMFLTVDNATQNNGKKFFTIV